MNLKENKWSPEEEALLKSGLFASQLAKHPLLINRSRGAIQSKLERERAKAKRPPKQAKVVPLKAKKGRGLDKEEKEWECSRTCTSKGVCDLTCEPTAAIWGRLSREEQQAMHQDRERGYPL